MAFRQNKVATMKRTKITTLLFLVMITLPVLPLLPYSGINPDYESIPNNESITPYSSPNAFSAAQQELSLSASSTNEVQPPEEEEPITQPPPDYQQGMGGPRLVQSTWNISETFTDCDNVTDYSVYIDKGMMYHDISNFTRVGKIDTQKSYIAPEDYNPLDGWRWYWPMDEKQWPGEVVFMAFNVTGQAPLHLTEFAIYLYSPTPPDPITEGDIEFTVFGAEYSSISGLGTQPDLSNQVAPWMQDYIDPIPRGTEQWVSLTTGMYSVILDPSMTYANTFYFAITMMPGGAIAWAFMEDTGSPPDGDGVDEGDAWYSDPWPELYFFNFPPSIDFFLIAAFNRFPYPSEVGMTVNSSLVFDLWPNPGTGLWDGGWHSPAINMTGQTRYYDVDFLFPAITYDVTWLGWFYENIFANTTFTTWAYESWVDWNVSFYVNYPSRAIDQRLLVLIEDDWTTLEVLVDGIPHPDWSVVYSPGTGWWVEIDNARTGQWTVLCDAPDYVISAEVLDSLNQTVTELYATETAYTRGYVQDGLGENATNGLGYLIIYDPYGMFHIAYLNPLSMPPGGLVEHTWDIWGTSMMGGVYTLQILWTNGTEAGLNVVTLGVWHQTQPLLVESEYPEPNGELLRGEEAYVQFYYQDIFGLPITRADIWVYNETGMENTTSFEIINYSPEWPGWYMVYIFTDEAKIGSTLSYTIHVVQDYYDEQTYFKQFTIRSRATHIVFLLGHGLDNSTSEWRTSPEPYINTTNIEFTIQYTDDNGFPLADATLIPYFVHNGTGQWVRLDWIDLHVAGLGAAGYYNITVDTNPIMGTTFHAGDPGFIVIFAYKIGFEGVWSDYPGEPGLIWVRPQARPSFIDVPAEYQDIELYEDWLYPTPEHPNILRVVLRDSLSGEDLSHGTVVLDLPGGGFVLLDLATPGLGLYEITALDTSLATPGSDYYTIRSTATDFTNATTTVRITIHPKQEISYDVNPTFQGPPNHNSRWSLDIQFRLESITPQFIITSQGGAIQTSSKQSSSDYLPVGTKVTLSITVQGGGSTQIEKYVEADGWIHFDGMFATEGQYSFYLTIDDAENYAGIPQEALQYNGGPFTVSVQSIGSYFLSNPIFIIAAVCIIVVPLGAGLSYRRYVMLPKRRRKLEKYQAIADTFSDVANLNRLLVLHKDSGICVFDPFAEESQDATLVAGFLQAISTFGHDLADSPGLANGEKEEATLRELTYEGFRILIHDGQFVRNALVLSGQPSDQLRNRLENFTSAFEQRYHSDFENWAGRVDQFNGASDLVEEIFLISLRHPHSVAKRKPRNVQLTSLESDIYKLSKELTLDREYVFLGQILSTYLTAAKTDKREALMAIYQLRVKGVFNPIQLDPITPPDVSAA